MNVVIAMRYHGAVFGAMATQSVVVFDKTPKLKKLADDLHLTRLHLDASQSEIEVVLTLQLSRLVLDSVNSVNSVNSFNSERLIPAASVRRIILSERKKREVLVRVWTNDKTLDESYTEVLKLITLSGGANDANIVCDVLTGNVNSRYLYGLSENMKAPGFDLYKACKYIFEDFAARAVSATEIYAEKLDLLKTLPTFEFDEFNAADSYHRSGWAYVVCGLLNVSSKRSGRSPSAFLDTYVDRTFHWGRSTYLAKKVIPYKKPWIGIIHHTFDTIDLHNSLMLFETPEFIESLGSCVSIVALSHYLGDQIREKLCEKGFPGVPVTVIRHPTETNVEQFSFPKFLTNPSKLLMQIGSWLREEDAIDQLDLKDNLLKLVKTKIGTRGVSGFVGCGDLGQTAVTITNTRLSNQEFDKALTKNVVFLKLRDCSAVNTVLECMARDTPIIINRHPAIEELLGASDGRCRFFRATRKRSRIAICSK